MAPVAIVLPRRASASSPVSRSAMMPEPTTAATRNAVPSASAARRRPRPKRSTDTLRQTRSGAACSRRPISSSRFCSESRSMLASGRLVKIEILLVIMR